MSFIERLNGILPRLTSPEFLESRGLGNEIAFYVFDYPPEEELRMRAHIKLVQETLSHSRPDLNVKHIDLFDLVLDYLNKRNILDKSFEMQKKRGDEALFQALAAPLHESKLAEVFKEVCSAGDLDFVMVSGVGNVWPLLRTHTLLNNLHPVLGTTPLVMFFPGKYDGQALQLFGKLKDDNYYRAFRLVP